MDRMVARERRSALFMRGPLCFNRGMQFLLGTIRFVPIVHRRVAFADEVRRAVAEFRPDVIAVELPHTLSEWIVRGVLRLPRISAVCYEEDEQPGALHYVPIDPCDGLIEAVRLGCAREIPVEFIDLDLPGLAEPPRRVPDEVIVERAGYEEYAMATAPFLASAPEDAASRARECQMARRLRAMAEGGRRVLCVLGLGHWSGVVDLIKNAIIRDPREFVPIIIEQRSGVTLADVRHGSLIQYLGELPAMTWAWHQQRRQAEDYARWGSTEFDTLDALRDLLRAAARRYKRKYRTTINLTQWRALFQYMRNLAWMDGRLRPELYELVVGAQGVVDGDFAYELLELLRRYPPQADPESGDLPRLKFIAGVGGNRAQLEGREERFTLAPRWPEPDGEVVRLNLRRRPPRRMRERWQKQWEHNAQIRTCSWPPEDTVQEHFMDYVRKRALQVVGEDRKQVVEFSTSLLDGLELRETMRNWHSGKLFVQTTPQPRGKVGAVVVIFEDEDLREEQSWRATLYAENQNESDIAFYATPLGEHVVGPRICRTDFKGILSVFPAWGIPDLWRFQMGPMVRSCAEALILGGVMFSPHKYVAVVAERPPRAELRQIAEHYGRHIIYMPLTMFARAHLRKIRRFHILDGHEVRAWARDYIFED